MVSSTETINISPTRPGPAIEVINHEQSLEAACAAMLAIYYWALCRRASNGNGSNMNADRYVVEVSHVER